MKELIGRAHNLCPGDVIFLTTIGWVTVQAVDADPTGHVMLDVTTYGTPSPVIRQALPWDAPVVAVLAG